MKRTTSSVKRAAIGLALALGTILGAAPTAASDAPETREYAQSSGPVVAAQVSPERAHTLTSCLELTDSVVRLYSAYFLRWPDQSGFEFWLNQYSDGVRNLDLISQFFTQSDEFRTRYGHLSNEQFVTLVYNNVMGRAPDGDGQAFWVSRLNAGMTRGTLMLNFSESAEYAVRTGTITPAAGYFSWYPVGTRWQCGFGYREVELLNSDSYIDVGIWNGLDQPSMMQIDVHNVVSGWVQPGFSFVVDAGHVNLYRNQNFSGHDVLRFNVPQGAGWFVIESPTAMPRDRSGW